MTVSTRVLLFSISLLLFISVAGATALYAQQPYEYMDVFDTEYVTDPRIAPDGNQVVYQRNKMDVHGDRRYSNLWIMNTDGTGHQPLTTGKTGYGSPRWSPDGNRLAYVTSGEDGAQIFVRWVDTGETSAITNLTESPGGIAWSPDGEYIAFTMNVPGERASLGNHPAPPEGVDWAPEPVIIDHENYRRDGNPGFIYPSSRHIFVVPADGGAPRQITSGDYDHGSPEWGPDGETIYFSANRDEDATLQPGVSHIYKVDVASGDITQLTDEDDGYFYSPVASPDGEQMAIRGNRDPEPAYSHARLYLMDADGGGIRELLADLDRSKGSVAWKSDGSGLYLQYDSEGVGHVASIDLQGDKTVLTDDLGGTSFGRPYTGGSYTVADNGDYAYTLSSPYHPAEVAVGSADRPGTIERLTYLNKSLLENRDLGEVEEIWYESRADGWDIQGWVIYPPDFDPNEEWPLILEIHGGPYLDYGPMFTPEHQLKAAQGYVVLYTNPRGSTSYSEEFAQYINYNYPSEDHDDLMSGVDYMLDRGYINEDELFIAGGSGGGVLSSWAIGQTDRFAAAAPNKPVINWHSFAMTGHSYISWSKNRFTAMPWEDPEQYLERSPISQVGNVTTPTLLITGEQDWNTPMSETEQFYNALQLQGVESMKIRVPETDHGIAARPSNLIRKVSYIVDWFDRYREQ